MIPKNKVIFNRGKIRFSTQDGQENFGLKTGKIDDARHSFMPCNRVFPETALARPGKEKGRNEK